MRKRSDPVEFHALLHCDNILVTQGNSLILVGLAPAVDVSDEPAAPHLTLFTQMAYVTYTTDIQTTDELSGLWWQINGNNNISLITLPARVVVPHESAIKFGTYIHTGSFVIDQSILREHDSLTVMLLSYSPMSILQEANFSLIKTKHKEESD